VTPKPRLYRRIADIAATEWDSLAGNENPFISHAFLASLEESGAVGDQSGWSPHHLLLEDEAGRKVAAAPMYLKGHSYGEYVFDHAWAQAYERAGGRYYPKLLIAAPFTPVPGPRLLAREDATRKSLVQAAIEVARSNGLSSLHVNFLTEGETAIAREAGMLLRGGSQFHWQNPGYRDFDDFLGALAARKRKAIRKERREVTESGIEIIAKTGPEIREAEWDAMHAFYMDTGGRKWGRPYLNRAFFSVIGRTMADRIVLFLALRGDVPIAGALNFLGADCLYGRYWGALETVRHLHFELCYYRAIDWAIAHRLARVEAGAQGPHKLSRGYLPRPTWSAHWIADPGFRQAVERYLLAETRAVEDDIEELEALGPFRRDAAVGDKAAG